MPYSVKGLTSYNIGSEILYEKLLNKNYFSSAAQKSTSSIISDVYRKMYLTNYITVEDVLNKYIEQKEQLKETQQLSNDEAYRLELARTARNYTQQYIQDTLLPENSTVSYHV